MAFNRLRQCFNLKEQDVRQANQNNTGESITLWLLFAVGCYGSCMLFCIFIWGCCCANEHFHPPTLKTLVFVGRPFQFFFLNWSFPKSGSSQGLEARQLDFLFWFLEKFQLPSRKLPPFKLTEGEFWAHMQITLPSHPLVVSLLFTQGCLPFFFFYMNQGSNGCKTG